MVNIIRNFLKPRKAFPIEESFAQAREDFSIQLKPKPTAIDDALLRAEQDIIARLLPDMRGKKVVIVDDGKRLALVRHAALAGAEELACFFSSEAAMDSLSLGVPGFQGSLSKSPLRKNHFDVIISPLALTSSEIVETAFSELAKGLRHMGRMIITVVHPFIDSDLQKNSRGWKTAGGVSRIFSQLREAGLYTDQMSEAFLPSGIQSGVQTQQPLIIGFRAIHYQKKLSKRTK